VDLVGLDVSSRACPRPAQVGLRQRAGLEGQEVALQRLLGLADLGVYRPQLLTQTGDGGMGALAGIREGLPDEVGVGIGGQHAVEDGPVELLRRQPLGVAVSESVPMASDADVVTTRETTCCAKLRWIW